jgi:hypothetical protein
MRIVITIIIAMTVYDQLSRSQTLGTAILSAASSLKHL